MKYKLVETETDRNTPSQIKMTDIEIVKQSKMHGSKAYEVPVTMAPGMKSVPDRRRSEEREAARVPDTLYLHLPFPKARDRLTPGDSSSFPSLFLLALGLRGRNPLPSPLFLLP